MSDLFREIEEDLQHDRYKKLWAKYGNLVIAAAVAFVVGTAGWQGWKAYRLRQEEALGQRYATALALAHAGNSADAEAGFAKLASDANAGYAALARLQEAALLAKAGKNAEAIAVYDKLAADGSVERPYRDLATLLAAMHESDTGDAAQLIKRLEPLTASASPWRYAALELQYRGRLDVGKTSAPPPDAKRELYDAMCQIAATGAGPREQIASMGCSIKWRD